MYFYTDSEKGKDKWSLPNAETVYTDGNDTEFGDIDTGEPYEKGWYFWFCFPGCLPESNPFGPYETEENAINAAREMEE